jgi:glycosyltransferase involved in cell wall biosynthesis
VADAVTAYTNARKVFCVSHGNLDLLRLQVGAPLRNAEVIWNPYGVSPECATAWPNGEGVWRMACIARLDPAAKGQDLLLRILASPQWRERPIEANIFGSGSYETNLRRMAEKMDLKSVNFQGYVSNIEEIWKRNHLLVLPSRYEGLPLALIEAMWCGRPAVATDVGGNAELCVDGETGFIASAPTISSFGDTLERAWQRRSDWQNMGKAARARAEALVPKNPVALFCEELKRCAKAGPEIGSVGAMTYVNR